MKYYLDANVFILAFVNHEDRGERARFILDAVVKGKCAGVTSFLSFDEFFWSLRKVDKKENVLQYAKNFLDMPHLQFIPVDEQVMRKSYQLLQQYPLDPRDAIHAASAILAKTDSFLSDDDDFGQVKAVNWRKL
ncbi:PIN domain-containing protein [Candidatus Woesearchaeota archaeon]|nr:PIN domain-containing protein [Candidatus Woesearchaeota archaeon]